MDRISLLPLEVLAMILKIIPDKSNLFTVSKSFYNAASLAAKNEYRFMLDENTKVSSIFLWVS